MKNVVKYLFMKGVVKQIINDIKAKLHTITGETKIHLGIPTLFKPNKALHML